MANGNFAGGSGVEGDPYLIEDAFDLDAVRNEYDGYYELINDINLDTPPFNEGEGWRPIFHDLEDQRDMKFNFNGNGFIVSGMYINNKNLDNAGLFSIERNGEIKNLQIKDFYIKTEYSAAPFSSIIDRSCHYYNCSAEDGIIDTGDNRASGFIEYPYIGIRFENCYTKNIDIVNGGGNFSRRGLTENTYTNCYASNYSSKDSITVAFSNYDDRDTYVNCFYNKDLVGSQTHNGAVGLTTEEMKTSNVFVDAGWDTELWMLSDGNYPILRMFSRFTKKHLVKDNQKTMTYKDEKWVELGGSVDKDMLINEGIENIYEIPESKWNELENPTILFYTEEPDKTEVLFSVEKDQFDLIDELGSDVKLKMYTDEAEVETTAFMYQTEDYTIAGYFGEEDVELVTYSDNPDGEYNVSLERENSFDLIDETNDIGVRTWTEEQQDLSLDTTGFTNVYAMDEFKDGINIHGISENEIDRVEIEFEPSGNYYKHRVTYDDTESNAENAVIYEGDWTDQPYENEVEIEDGMIEHINPYNINVKVEQLDETKIQDSTQISLFNSEPIFLMGAVSYNTLSVTIDDEEGDRVQHQIWLNGEKVFPEGDQEWSDLTPSPRAVLYDFDQTKIEIGEINTCLVRARDEWGETGEIDLSFIGAYDGLLFSNEDGDFYSIDPETILKRLDFGTIIAGFQSDVAKVILTNQNYYAVKNLEITIDKANIIKDTDVMLSKTDGHDFDGRDRLVYNENLESGDQIEFYVRVNTDILAGGFSTFDINTKAEIVDDLEQS